MTDSTTTAAQTARPYSALAPLYDQVMAHVDYDHWAEYVLTLCDRYSDSPRHILELGCGTGNLTLRLCRRLSGTLLATDRSPEMLEVARRKLQGPSGRGVTLAVADFRDLQFDRKFDVIILAYDGINYLLESAEVGRLVQKIEHLLNPGGIFLFDQSTPSNSVNNIGFFDDSWESHRSAYSRSSEYDAARRLHTTRFSIRRDGQTTEEVHFQRAYRLQEMEMILKLSSLRTDGCFDAFSFAPATGESERIQWVLSKHHPTA